jgi:hypothetical protein
MRCSKCTTVPQAERPSAAEAALIRLVACAGESRTYPATFDFINSGRDTWVGLRAACQWHFGRTSRRSINCFFEKLFLEERTTGAAARFPRTRRSAANRVRRLIACCDLTPRHNRFMRHGRDLGFRLVRPFPGSRCNSATTALLQAASSRFRCHSAGTRQSCPLSGGGLRP